MTGRTLAAAAAILATAATTAEATAAQIPRGPQAAIPERGPQ